MDKTFTAKIVGNLSKILRDKNLTQAAMAEYAGTTASQFSRILSGQTSLTLEHISNIARNLAMSEIDIITYPEKYIRQEPNKPEQVEAILQIKLQKDKKDQVLKLVFGEHNLELLNK
ncbi:MAG: helix-turn-helix transcriptional regulator [Bacteroidales bacterium]|nr:helix-turn-helix transcriptional regulator [Bacteroidales bacterium]